MLSDDASFGIDREVLLSVAQSAPLESGLESIVAMRPLIAEALADQATFVVATLSKLRALSKVPRHLRSAAPEDSDHLAPVVAAIANQPLVVMIGCGFIGSCIADRLLLTRCIHPTGLYIMTRQPDTLRRYSKLGARCGVLSEAALAQADIILVAVLPGQLSAVARVCRGHVKDSAVIYSLCAGVTPAKVSSEFQHAHCLAADIDTTPISHSALCVDSYVSVRNHAAHVLSNFTLPNDLMQWLNRFVFVAASAATSTGLTFHFATFAVWSYLCTENTRLHWQSSHKDFLMPSTADAKENFSRLSVFCENVVISPEAMIMSVREKARKMLFPDKCTM